MMYDVCMHVVRISERSTSIPNSLHDELAPDERACQVSGTSPLPLTPHPSIYNRILDNVKYTHSLSFRWDLDTNNRCEVCDSGGDLLKCDFYNASWHYELTCLRGSPRATSENDGDFWARPACWVGAKKRFGKRARKHPAAGAARSKRGRRRR